MTLSRRGSSRVGLRAPSVVVDGATISGVGARRGRLGAFWVGAWEADADAERVCFTGRWAAVVVDEDGCEDEAGMGRVSLWLERIDCDEVGREGG